MALASTNSISIIIASYNSSTTIGRAIKSALNESETKEVIVVDDASDDDTLERAKFADDKSGRLKILSLAKNSGPSVARNRALEICQSDWIGILDSDDFMLPGRLHGLLSFNEEADMIADDIWQVDEHDIEGPRKLILGSQLKKPCTISFKEFISSNITDLKRPRSELGFIKPLIRRSFLVNHNIRYQDSLRLGEDYELYARALAYGARLLLIPPQGYISVIRSNSLSARHSEEDLRQLRDCDKILSKLPRLINDDKKILWQHYLSIECRLQWRLLIVAIKQRNIYLALSTFFHPFPVPIYLVSRLWEQLILRTRKKLNYSIDNSLIH
jgi:succinoglycan biosynthesis protein ExoU